MSSCALPNAQEMANNDGQYPPSESDSFDEWADEDTAEAEPEPKRRRKDTRLENSVLADETLNYDPEEDEHLMDPDHVGFWREEDTQALVRAINYYRKDLKGNYQGPGGGKKKRDRAWGKVAAHINTRCGTNWTDRQCQGKAGRYAREVKQKYQVLKRLLQKTGGGTIADEHYLKPHEESMLDYVGVEGVVGIPGCAGVPLVPNMKMSANIKRLEESARAAWDYDRPSIPNYREALPSDRVRCSTPSPRGKGKGRGKGRGGKGKK